MKDEERLDGGESEQTFTEYSLVRVKKLLHIVEYYDGWKINQRSPQIGDVGTIVEILLAPNLPIGYIVECSNNEGYTIWLSIFLAEEIEPV
jgi:hypothetical protein